MSRSPLSILVYCLLLVFFCFPSIISCTSEFSSSFLSSAPLYPNDKCTLCKSLTGWLGPFLSSNSTIEKASEIIFPICEALHPECNGKSSCSILCQGVINEHAQIIFYLLRNDIATPDKVCHFLKACPAPPSSPTFPVGLPVKANLTNFNGQKIWPSWKLTSGQGYFIHLSDIHLDLWYSLGSTVNCGLPLCCRPGFPSINESHPGQARPWGEYNCDTTNTLLNGVLKHIAALNPPPDFILYTGDSPAHDIWNQTIARNLLTIDTICSKINEFFPSIPVFQAVGNHESFPVDQFDAPNKYNDPDNIHWLYSALQRDWAYYLPDEAIHSLASGGFYQALVRPGLRVISFNGNYYANQNFFLDFNNTDFTRQFQWLEDTLQQIQVRGQEKVILIGHTRPWDWKFNYTQRYNELVIKYSNLILNQFYGHSHTAEISLFNDHQGNPINTAYIGGSVTTFTNLNPGFRLYTYNRENIAQQSILVEDYLDYWSPLDLTNAKNSTFLDDPHITATRDFNIPDLSPKSIQDFANSVLTNSSTFQSYVLGKYKGVLSRNSDTPINVHCDVLYSYKEERDQCKKQKGMSEKQIEQAHEKLC
jgi:sphingomyelin phosphodiesterase